ncbi:MAG: hypothetical protein ABI415_01835 [Flavitalea sp.]
MKSNRQHTPERQVPLSEPLLTQIKKEKEALVSMLLANASISELAEQYKRIDELHARISSGERGQE